MSETVILIIHFNDGTKKTFSFPRLAKDTTCIVTKIDKFLVTFKSCGIMIF